MEAVVNPPFRVDWELQGDPFPCAGRTLSPQNDVNQLSLYLDFYNWEEADLFGGLGPDGTIQIIAPPGNATTTILISGQTGSGRSSVKNLIIYALEQDKNPKPIVLD